MDKYIKKKADSKGATFGRAKHSEAHNIDYNDPEKPKTALEDYYIDEEPRFLNKKKRESSLRATLAQARPAGAASSISFSNFVVETQNFRTKKRKKSGLAAANARSAVCVSQWFEAMERRRPSPPWYDSELSAWHLRVRLLPINFLPRGLRALRVTRGKKFIRTRRRAGAA